MNFNDELIQNSKLLLRSSYFELSNEFMIMETNFGTLNDLKQG